jgi:hypothetical protein
VADIALMMVAMGNCDNNATITESIGKFFEFGDVFMNLGFDCV